MNIDNFFIFVVRRHEDSYDKIKDINNVETMLGDFIMIDNIRNKISIKGIVTELAKTLKCQI